MLATLVVMVVDSLRFYFIGEQTTNSKFKYYVRAKEVYNYFGIFRYKIMEKKRFPFQRRKFGSFVSGKKCSVTLPLNSIFIEFDGIKHIINTLKCDPLKREQLILNLESSLQLVKRTVRQQTLIQPASIKTVVTSEFVKPQQNPTHQQMPPELSSVASQFVKTQQNPTPQQMTPEFSSVASQFVKPAVIPEFSSVPPEFVKPAETLELSSVPPKFVKPAAIPELSSVTSKNHTLFTNHEEHVFIPSSSLLPARFLPRISPQMYHFLEKIQLENVYLQQELWRLKNN